MKPNLTSSLVEHLRERISSGSIAAGEKLPSENALISEHGVSRTVVREAITRLQAEGLVYTRRGAGSFALTPPPQPQSDTKIPVPRTMTERQQLIEYRLGFETEAAAVAALSASDADLKSMDEALKGFEASQGNASLSMNCDYEFHLAVARATGNPYFAHAVQGFGPSMIAMPRRRLDSTAAVDAERLGSVTTEHRAVREAIAAGNPQLAAAAMRLHLGNSIQRLQAEAGQDTA
ncbi:FadR/GntR family transcriptional regulator [Glutamicibacter protophormiae]|uniref:FadR/GntR family transcriptional regulator n=1 Tax=Glutamicibacter protophormiae TaxID=37930 RepID=UPI003A906711